MTLKLTINPIMAMIIGHPSKNHSSGSSIVSNHFQPTNPPSQDKNIEKPMIPSNNNIKLSCAFFGTTKEVLRPMKPMIPNNEEIKVIMFLKFRTFNVTTLYSPKKEKHTRIDEGINPVNNNNL